MLIRQALNGTAHLAAGIAFGAMAALLAAQFAKAASRSQEPLSEPTPPPPPVGGLGEPDPVTDR